MSDDRGDPWSTEAAWRQCAFCWGQRRIFEHRPSGRGHRPTACPCCLGVGEVCDLDLPPRTGTETITDRCVLDDPD